MGAAFIVAFPDKGTKEKKIQGNNKKVMWMQEDTADLNVFF